MQTKDTNEMGKVFITLTIINRADQIRAEDGTITPEQIRSVTLKNVLVDTGATTLCLPQSVTAQLGLKLLREVDVATTMGIVNLIKDGKYIESEISATFPNLPIFAAIPRFVEQSKTVGRSPTLRAFRLWVREQI
jgi:hypothetical protein